MKTPMQELIEELKEQAQFITDDDCAQDKFFRAGLRNAIKYAEWLLEKEKEFITNFAMDYVFSGEVGCAIWADGPPELDIDKSAKQYYEQTFNTKEK